MSAMFLCSSLCSLTNISNWNTNNVTTMSNMFNKYSKLKPLPDISKWDKIDLFTRNYFLYGCSNIIISKIIAIFLETN